MRRRRDDDEVGELVPPARLMRCHVEDWLSAEELAQLKVAPPEQGWSRPGWPWHMQALLETYMRHRRARREWLEARGAPPDLIPRSYPRFGRSAEQE